MPEEVYVCELCGDTFVGKPVIINLDGYEAKVCPKCARKLLGRREMKEVKVAIKETKTDAPLRKEQPRKPPKGVPPSIGGRKVEEIEYVEGYGEKIREARESLGLTIEQVAAALKMKASLLRNIEAEKVIPPYEIARAIEKLLEIDIIQRNPERSASALPETAPHPTVKSITLGEIVDVKRKRRKR